jgi:predicted RNA binding protein YcfA (HicA-like mRNA interferase family)
LFGEHREESVYNAGSWNEMPRKIRELIADLEKHGFVNRGGKGSHRNFTHPSVIRPVTIAGDPGDDAKQYQEKAVKAAITEAKG